MIEDNNETETPHASSNRRSREEVYKTLVNQALARYTQLLASKKNKEEETSFRDEDALNETVKLVEGQTRERLLKRVAVIDMPQRHDVLFGRGKNERNHSGNKNLRRICQQRKAIYDAADRDEKTEISKDIVNEIKSIGGLFLKLNDTRDGWLIASDADARQKVSHLMRDTQLGMKTK